MKKISLLIGLAAILAFGAWVYAAKNSSTPAVPGLSANENLPIEQARDESWAQDPRSNAMNTAGLEEFLPQVKEEVKPGLAFGDLVAQYTWAALGIPDPAYGGAGISFGVGTDGRPYLFIAHQGYANAARCGIYILDLSFTPPVLVDRIPRAELRGTYRVPWGVGTDNEGQIWYGDISWNVYDWVFEYSAFPPHPLYTGNNFNHRQGYAFMADITGTAPGDTFWVVKVGDDSHIYGFREPAGNVVRNFGDVTWDYISQRGLAWNTDDGSMHIGGWNVSTVWEISPINGAPIPGRSFSCTGVAGLAYQPQANGGPYLWAQENSSANLLKKYHCPPLLADDITMARIITPDFYLVGAGTKIGITVEAQNKGTMAQGFDAFARITDAGVPVLQTQMLGLNLAAFASMQIAFPDTWTVPGEIGKEFQLETWVVNPGDLDRTNDSLKTKLEVAPACDKKQYDDGTEGNAFYFGGAQYYFGAKFVGTKAPTGMVWGAINTCSPGDRFWPWPNASLDSIEVSVFSQNPANPAMPAITPVWTSRVKPAVSPTWIVFEPDVKKAISNGTNIWLCMRNYNYPAWLEGLMVDLARNFYGVNVYGYSGNWYSYDSYGDWHMRGCLWYPPALEWVEDELEATVHPPDPWVEPLLVEIPGHVWGMKDNVDVVFWSDPLRCGDRILTEINFVPAIIPSLPKGDTAEVTAYVQIPIGQHAGTYTGYFRVMNDTCDTDSVPVSLTIGSTCDLDINDDYANLTANRMLLAGDKPSGDDEVWYGGYAICCGGKQDNSNPDFWDGPGALDLDAVSYDYDFPFEVDPDVVGIASVDQGYTKTNILQVTVPAQGTGAHKMFGGTVTVTGYNTADECESSDEFTLLVQLDPPGHWGDRSIGGKFLGSPEQGANSLSWSSAGLGEVGYNLYRGSTSSFIKLNSSPLTEMSYSDGDVVAGSAYQYKLGLVFEDGSEVVLGPLSVTTKVVPRVYSLSQNFPNPVKSETVIRYGIPSQAKVSLTIYDITGRVVETLVDEHQNPGLYSATWKPAEGANGVYFYRLTAGDFTQTRKLAVLK